MRRDGCPASRRPDGREWLRCGGWKSALRCCGSAGKRPRNGWKARWRRVRWLRNGSQRMRCCGSGRKNCRKDAKASRCGCPKRNGWPPIRKDAKSNSRCRSSDGTARSPNGWRSNRRNGSGCCSRRSGSGCRSRKNGSGCHSCCRKSGRHCRSCCRRNGTRCRYKNCGSWKMTNSGKERCSCCGNCRTNGSRKSPTNGSRTRRNGSPIRKNDWKTSGWSHRYRKRRNGILKRMSRSGETGHTMMPA